MLNKRIFITFLTFFVGLTSISMNLLNANDFNAGNVVDLLEVPKAAANAVPAMKEIVAETMKSVRPMIIETVKAVTPKIAAAPVNPYIILAFAGTAMVGFGLISVSRMSGGLYSTRSSRTHEQATIFATRLTLFGGVAIVTAGLIGAYLHAGGQFKFWQV